MTVTILSPDMTRLAALRDQWDRVVEEFGAAEAAGGAEAEPDDELEGLERMGGEEIDVPALAQAKFTEDRTIPNGSSIAVMLSFSGKRALMLADAHPSLVLESVKKLS